MKKTPIPFDSIETILLDMDGTLLDLHFDDHFWQEHVPLRYAEYNHLSIKAAKAVLTPLFKKMEGTLEWYCVDYWSRELQMNIPELKTEVAHLIAIHDGVLHFLNKMRQLNKPVYLVTNAHQKVLELKMQKTQLSHQFDKIISSHTYGLPKENPKFWHQLVDTHFFDPEKTLFVDDSLPVLRSAQQFGIKYLYSIQQPSSHKPPRSTCEFPMIHSFFEATSNIPIN